MTSVHSQAGPEHEGLVHAGFHGNAATQQRQASQGFSTEVHKATELSSGHMAKPEAHKELPAQQQSISLNIFP